MALDEVVELALIEASRMQRAAWVDIDARRVPPKTEKK